MASFEDVRFTGGVSFEDIQFTGGVSFEDTQFTDWAANFEDARVASTAEPDSMWPPGLDDPTR